MVHTKSLIFALYYLFRLLYFLMLALSCVSKYINASANRWQMEAEIFYCHFPSIFSIKEHEKGNTMALK